MEYAEAEKESWNGGATDAEHGKPGPYHWTVSQSAITW